MMTIQGAGNTLLQLAKRTILNPQNKQLVGDVTHALAQRFPIMAQELATTFGKGTEARTTMTSAWRNAKNAVENATHVNDLKRGLTEAFKPGGDGTKVLSLFSKQYGTQQVALNKAGTKKAANQFNIVDILRVRANAARKHLETTPDHWQGALQAFLQPARPDGHATRGSVRALLHRAKVNVAHNVPQVIGSGVQHSRTLWDELWKA